LKVAIIDFTVMGFARDTGSNSTTARNSPHFSHEANRANRTTALSNGATYHLTLTGSARDTTSSVEWAKTSPPFSAETSHESGSPLQSAPLTGATYPLQRADFAAVTTPNSGRDENLLRWM
jgi:hypothetical protein